MANILFRRVFYGAIIIIVVFMSFYVEAQENNNAFTRGYQNLTTHYNIYFNAKESLNEAESLLKKMAFDNYAFLLPVYNYGTLENIAQVEPQLNRAVEKATIAIPRHTMYFDGLERNRWIDDCYLIIAKAQFLRQDYSSSQLTFKDIINEYSGTASAEEAYIWYVRSLIGQKKFKDALGGISTFEKRLSLKKTSKKVSSHLPLLYAEYFLALKEYPQATKYLQDAIATQLNKDLRMRLIYILGQLAFNEKKYDKAMPYFKKIAKSNVSFEMEFNAKINLLIAWGLTQNSTSPARKDIMKMLIDKKYQDYKDRIYYALYELALADKNLEDADKYLIYSAMYATGNNAQKISAYKKLADWHFEKEKYNFSFAYADSVLQILPETYPDYDAIKKEVQIKKEISKNLNIVKVEDSLQDMAKLSEYEINEKIRKEIETVSIAEQIRTEANQNASKKTSRYINRPYIATPQQMGMPAEGWYFDNRYIVSIGISEFARKWGNRELVDNWRVSSKIKTALPKAKQADTSPADSIYVNDEDVAMAMKSFDKKNPESYLKAIPRTKADVKTSNKKIAKALIKLGYIYKDDLNDYPKAIAFFEDYVKRFSTTEEDFLSVYFQLYSLGKENGNNTLANKYEKIILNDYPTSDFAQAVRDPAYMKVLYDKKFGISSLYEKTYLAHINGQYKLVLTNSEKALTEYKHDKELSPRFEYLKAIALGKSQGTEAMITSLLKLIKDYPNHPVASLAKEDLGQYNTKEAFQYKGVDEKQPEANIEIHNNRQTADNKPKQQQTADEYPLNNTFTYAPSKAYYYLFVYDNLKTNQQELRKDIWNIASKHFVELNMSLNIIQWTEKLQILALSKFTEENVAMDFYKKINREITSSAQFKHIDYKHFVINAENYPVLFKDKKTEEYQKFFNKNYNK